MFILSKLIIALISPLGTSLAVGIFALLLACFGRRRLAAVSGALALVWLGVWSLPASSFWLIGLLESDYVSVDIQTLPNSGAVVVLGGGISPAESQTDFANLQSGADRIWHAARLYHAGKAGLIVLSGGRPAGTVESEAQAMQGFLWDLGVPDSYLLLEDRSLNTTENAVNTAALLRKRGVSEIVLITSAYHMPRAKALFETQGLQVVAAATDYQSVAMPPWRLWLPDTKALDISGNAFKELVGRWSGR